MSINETDLAATFDLLAGMAFRGTCLSVLVLLLVFCLRKSVCPQIRFLLLILAMLRLALPVAPASGLSLFNARPDTWFTADSEESFDVEEAAVNGEGLLLDGQVDPQPVEQSIPEVATSSLPPEPKGPPHVDSAIRSSIAATQSPQTSRTQPGVLQSATSEPRQFPWKALLLLISAAGTVLILGRALVAMGQWKAILARSTENAILQCCADRLLDEMKMWRRVRVVTSPDCDQLGLHGFLNPVIILPPWCSELSASDVRMLLRHELTHVKRFDHRVFRLTEAVAAIHWWNPIVRRTVAQLRRECELACDQTVLKSLAAEERRQYGNLLLEVADRQIARRSAFATLAFSPDASTLGERVRQSQDFSAPSWHSRVIAAFAVMAIAVFGLTDSLHDASPQAASAEEPAVAAPQTDTPAPEVVNLKGRYIDQGEKPVSRCYVGVFAGRSTAERVIRVAEGGTDEEGRFHIRGTLPELLRDPSAQPVHFVAVFWKRGEYATVMREWTDEAIADDLMVEASRKTKRIRGRVVDHRGKVVQGATVMLPNRLYAAIPTSHYGLTNAEGEFEIPNLPAGLKAEVLWVSHPDFGRMQFQQTDLPTEASTGRGPFEDAPRDSERGGVEFQEFDRILEPSVKSSQLTITIPEAGGIDGAVVHSETQSPVDSCVVTVWSKDRKQFAEVLTNERGEYRLRVLPGEYMLTVVAGKTEAKHGKIINVKAGETVSLPSIDIKDNRPQRSRQDVTSLWAGKKPDRVVEAAKISRDYQFLPTTDDVEAEAKQLLSKLKKLQDDHKSGQVEWAETLRSLIQLGSAAVPLLCEELDRTEQTDRGMLRSLPFILRGIGDTRSVPALIRAIPRCFGRDGSDMGYSCEDPELLSFLQKHDHHDHNSGLFGPDDDYSWGRPVNEVIPALRRLTGRGAGAFMLAHVAADRNGERHDVLGQRLYNQVAQDWAAFWEQNWKQFLADEKYRIVDVIPVATGEMPPPPSRDILLESNSGESNGKLASVLTASGRFVFRDLDTGLRGDLPEQFRKLSGAQRLARMDEIIAWARQYGFDLMGTEVDHNGVRTYVLLAIDMDVWEISKEDFNKSDTMNAIASRGRKVDAIIAHADESTGHYDYPAASYFCFVTSEGIPGKMLLGVPVTSTNQIAGFSDHTKDEFLHTGFYLGRRYALKWLKPAQ